MILCENMADSLSMNIPCCLCFMPIGKTRRMLKQVEKNHRFFLKGKGIVKRKSKKPVSINCSCYFQIQIDFIGKAWSTMQLALDDFHSPIGVETIVFLSTLIAATIKI